MAAQETPQFSKWRNFLWPIHGFEMKKFLPMLLIIFCIAFNYNILKTAKDSVIVTTAGAEIIPFIKLWVLFPMTIGMTALFTKLCQRYNKEKVFYVIMSIFLLYFSAFSLIIYPLREAFTPENFCSYLEVTLPDGFRGFVAMFRYWPLTLFYAMCELWSAIVLLVLFWGFANQVTRLHEAKRFYGLFGLGANSSGIFAAQTFIAITQKEFNPNIPFGSQPWEQTLFLLTGVVILSGLVAVIAFRWFNKKVLTDKRFFDESMKTKPKKEKRKLSLAQSFRCLSKSNYILFIALIVITYNVVICLTEVVWKDQVRTLYPNPEDYSLYMNQIMTIMGVIATVTGLFVSSNAIRKFGWTFTAMLTPLILFITSIGFFSSLLFDNVIEALTMGFFNFTPLSLAVFFGSAQNCLSRASKYTVFDTTKEIAYMPLESEAKIQGKAAIDGIGSRLGKSGGSLIFQCLLVSFGSLAGCLPVVGGLIFAFIFIWMYSVKELGKQFNDLTLENKKITLDFSSEKEVVA